MNEIGSSELGFIRYVEERLCTLGYRINSINEDTIAIYRLNGSPGLVAEVGTLRGALAFVNGYEQGRMDMLNSLKNPTIITLQE